MTREEREKAIKELQQIVESAEWVDSSTADGVSIDLIKCAVQALQTDLARDINVTTTDAISRQAALEQSIVLRDISNPDKEWEVVTVGTIKHLKSVQPEQKVGKWKYYNDDMLAWAICSVCKHDTGEPMQYAEKYFKYCPSCGAKMEEGEWMKQYKPLEMFTKQTDELKKLIAEHPDYPIVVLVYGEVCAEEDGLWYAPCLSFNIGEILDCEQDIDRDKTYVDRDDFEKDVQYFVENYDNLEDMTDEEFDAEIKRIMQEYEPYWKKVIAIYANV